LTRLPGLFAHGRLASGQTSRLPLKVNASEVKYAEAAVPKKCTAEIKWQLKMKKMYTNNLDFVQFFASRSRGSALQIFHFSAKFIAEGAIYERKNEKFASDSLGDSATKLYKSSLYNQLQRSNHA